MASKCSRPKCLCVVHRQGLCKTHYNASGTVRGYVDATKVKRRVRLLQERGMEWRSIEAASGLSADWWHWVRKHNNRVQARSAEKILSIPVPGRVISSYRRIPSIGTFRRVQALVAIGWPLQVLSRRLGWGNDYLSHLLSRSLKYVEASTAAKIDVLYRELNMLPGPSLRAREFAKAKGWLPSLAWDENSIDDPNASPYICVGRDDFADMIADERELGRDDTEIARRWGVKLDSLQRRLQRAGIPRNGPLKDGDT